MWKIDSIMPGGLLADKYHAISSLLLTELQVGYIIHKSTPVHPNIISVKINKNILGPNFFDPKLTRPKLFQTECPAAHASYELL